MRKFVMAMAIMVVAGLIAAPEAAAGPLCLRGQCNRNISGDRIEAAGERARGLLGHVRGLLKKRLRVLDRK